MTAEAEATEGLYFASLLVLRVPFNTSHMLLRSNNNMLQMVSHIDFCKIIIFNNFNFALDDTMFF